MPELPEVEVTRRGLEQALPGQRIKALRLGKPLRWPLGGDAADLQGRQIVSVGRRGKYLLLGLDDGGLLLLHLGMSGSVRIGQPGSSAGPHEHVEIELEHSTLRLHDPRRFGALVYASGDTDPVVAKLLGGLGVEPLTDAFTPLVLRNGFYQRRQSVKQALLAGDVVVGVGNIYACEVLFLAGIRPTLAAGKLSMRRLVRLHGAIQTVLQRAIDQGGSTLKDFVGVDGNAGHFQTMTHVYGRAGQPCHQCGTRIAHLVQGQRSTYFCPRCQRR